MRYAIRSLGFDFTGRFSSVTNAEADELHASLPMSKRVEIARNEMRCLREEIVLLEANADKDIDALKARFRAKLRVYSPQWRLRFVF